MSGKGEGREIGRGACQGSPATPGDKEKGVPGELGKGRIAGERGLSVQRLDMEGVSESLQGNLS